MMDMVFIPERLKGIREERNLSKAAAARLLNLSKMGYLRYETGDRTPSYQTIVFMAQKLGTSPEYLTGKENTPEPREYIISKTDDSELFALIQDMMDTKNPARTRLLAYYKELKASTALFKWLHFLLMSPRLPFQRDQYHPGSISNDILLVPD